MWEVNTDLVSYLPTWFREILELQQICTSEKEQMEALAAGIHAVAENFFVQTMNAGAVSLWEKVLDILPDPSVETLAFRRFRIQNRLTTKPPFTLGFLYQKLDEIIGPGAWDVRVDYPNYTLYIESSSKDQQYYTEVAYTINKIKPAHIVFVNAPLTATSLLLDGTAERTRLQWNYTLDGGWRLGEQAFATETVLEVIATAEQTSIQESLLAKTAENILVLVAAARINGNIVIDNLSKEVSGNLAVIRYTVTEAQASTVTEVTLLDDNGAELTNAPVYVPIEGQALFTHRIAVSEGGGAYGTFTR